MFPEKCHQLVAEQIKEIDASYSEWVLANIKIDRQMGFHREGADAPVSPKRKSECLSGKANVSFQYTFHCCNYFQIIKISSRVWDLLQILS